ncbi:MAG: PLP-dependent transferase, partial [Bacteroidota bacterium]|nr:PLP-dependent transferase [Bacteroidota bacterium]
EQRLSAWDESEDAAFFASGMAAITTTFLAWTSADRPLWICPPLYGGSEHFIREILPGMGVHVVEVDHLDHLDAILEREGGRKPGMIYLETPANPTMQIHRIRTAADWARQHETEYHRMIVGVDNTYLGPILQRPLEHGADVLVYSATKYIGGHSDLIAGAASGKADAVARIREYRHFLGGMADPNTCWMLMRSMETLAIRVRHQQGVAEQVFAHLRNHPKVQRFTSAWSVDLSDSNKAVAEEQMLGGGAMAAFEVAGGRAGAFRVLNAFKHFQLAVSLGSTESLAEHPASMTHAGVPPEVKAQYGISEGLIRISVGIERPEDLIADLDQALGQV